MSILLFRFSLNVKDGNSQAVKIFKGNLIAKLMKKSNNNLPFIIESQNRIGLEGAFNGHLVQPPRNDLQSVVQKNQDWCVMKSMNNTGKFFFICLLFSHHRDTSGSHYQAFFPAVKDGNFHFKTYADIHLSRASVLTLLSITPNTSGNHQSCQI